MKKTIILIAALILLLTGCASKQTSGTKQGAQPFQKVRHAEITVRDYGTIKLELDEGTAPITVANFIKLAKDGFYDGLTFHRIMDGFMIQGGDPLGNGTGGAKDTIKGEFSKNGVMNPISHVKNASAPHPRAFMPRFDALTPVGTANARDMPSMTTAKIANEIHWVSFCTAITNLLLYK